MFRNQFEDHDRVISEAGSKEAAIYTARYDGDGVLQLIQTGVQDRYAEIQSHAMSVDIHVLLKLAETDPTVLTRAQGAYFDSTDMPTTYAEMLNVVLRAEDAFNALTAEQKREFNNSFSEFLVQAGNADFVDKLAISNHVVSDLEVSDVSEQ